MTSQTIKPHQRTREAWAIKAVAVLTPKLAEVGIEMQGDRQVRIAVTPLPPSKLGYCHNSKASGDGRTNFIDLSSVQADPIELMHTLMHELLHAFDDCNSGHRGRWKRWAELIGIERRGHKRGPIADGIVMSALAEVGLPVTHVTSVHRKTERKSQARCVCPVCGRHAFMPRAAAEGGFTIACVADGAVMPITT